MIISHLKASAYQVVVETSTQRCITSFLKEDKDILNHTYLQEKIGPIKRLTIILYLNPKIPHSKRKKFIEDKIRLLD